MSGSRSRRKGHNWERELVHRFRDAMPGADGIKRGFQTRGGGKEEADVIVPHFHVEAKCGKRPNHRAALEQAIDDAAEGKTPIAVCKDDRKDPTVTMRLDDFLRFVGEWWRWEQAKAATAIATSRFNEEMERRYPNGAILFSRPYDAEAKCAAVSEGALCDGHGNEWPKCGPGCEMEIVRPGKVQCSKCDDAKVKHAAEPSEALVALMRGELMEGPPNLYSEGMEDAEGGYDGCYVCFPHGHNKELHTQRMGRIRRFWEDAKATGRADTWERIRKLSLEDRDDS